MEGRQHGLNAHSHSWEGGEISEFAHRQHTTPSQALTVLHYTSPQRPPDTTPPNTHTRMLCLCFMNETPLSQESMDMPQGQTNAAQGLECLWPRTPERAPSEKPATDTPPPLFFWSKTAVKRMFGEHRSEARSTQEGNPVLVGNQRSTSRPASMPAFISHSGPASIPTSVLPFGLASVPTSVSVPNPPRDLPSYLPL